MERDHDPVDELVFECLEHLAAGGSTAVDSVCARHPALAPALRQRIAALREAGLFPADGEQPRFPERLGDFRLLRRLGGGGMGVVYQAEQVSLRREVALKLIRPDYLYFPQSRERFRREVLAVASLQHEGIVPVYAGGEEAGIPYFAMEMIRGCTLADILDALAGRAPEVLSSADLARALAARSPPGTAVSAGDQLPKAWVETCLQLARQVALALAHAHARGIVHRDVKPSNIALTPEGRPMLLDFGLTSSGRAERVTLSGSAVGTLLYMSPEQVRGAGTLDARTDIYSLGVTLYELLTLQAPYRGEDDAASRKLILDGRPDSIRARNRRVSPDAETVCLKAMELDPARRYASAEAFARDLGNVLGYRPIEARRPGVLLRTRRFAQRRPATAVALVLGLAIALGLPTALYLQERGALVRIRAEAETSRQVTEFLVALFESAGPGNPLGEDVRLRPVLEQGAKRIESGLEEQPGIRARLLFTLARVYRNLGAYEQAERLLRRAIATLDSDAVDDPTLARDARWTLALLRCDQGDYAAAEAQYRSLLAALREQHGEQHALVAECLGELAEPLYQTGQTVAAHAALAEALQTMRSVCTTDDARLSERIEAMARFLVSTERPAEARALFEEALAMRERLFPNGAPVVVMTLCNLGRCLTELREWSDAEAVIRRAVAAAERTYADEHPAIAAVAITLAHFLTETGRWSEAEAPLQRALAIAEKVYGDAHPRVAWCLNDLAMRLQRAGNSTAAKPLFERARDVYRGVHPDGHRDLAITLVNLAETLGDLDRHEPAEAAAREALAMFEATAADSTHHVAACHVVLAGILLLRNALPDAETHARTAISLLERQPDHPVELGIALTRLALVLNRRGDGAAAQVEATRACELLRAELPAGHPYIGSATYHVGWALLNQRKHGEAERWLRDAEDLLRRAHPDGHPGLAYVLDHLGVLELGRGRPHEALARLRESLELRRRFVPRDGYWVQVSLHNVAVALLEVDDPTAALPLLEELIEVRSRRPQPDAELAATLHFAARAKLATGDRESADVLATRALEQRSRLYPAGNALRADTQSLLGAIKTELGDFAEAERLLVDAHGSLEQAMGRDSKNTGRCRARLARLYEAWGKPELAAQFR